MRRKYYVPEPESIKYPEGPMGRQVCQENAAGKREYKARTTEMWLRQDGICPICGKWMDQNTAQPDHQDGRGHGGGHRDDRVVDEHGEWRNAALCPTCNTLKGSKRYHWINGKYVQVLSKEVA